MSVGAFLGQLDLKELHTMSSTGLSMIGRDGLLIERQSPDRSETSCFPIQRHVSRSRDTPISKQFRLQSETIPY